MWRAPVPSGDQSASRRRTHATPANARSPETLLRHGSVFFIGRSRTAGGEAKPADGFNPPARKALPQALVQEIRVVSRDEIYPFFKPRLDHHTGQCPQPETIRPA